MGAHERLEFKLGEYLLKGIKYKFKESFGEACFRDDIARTSTAREGINMICVRGHRIISLREGTRVNTAQIASKCLTAARCIGIDAAKKAATRANIDGTGGKTFQCRNCKGDDDASTSCKSKTISSCAGAARKATTQQSGFLSKRSNSKRGKNEKNSTTDGSVRRRICGG